MVCISKDQLKGIFLQILISFEANYKQTHHREIHMDQLELNEENYTLTHYYILFSSFHQMHDTVPEMQFTVYNIFVLFLSNRITW